MNSLFQNIEAIHLEVSDRCNASCPMCARNILGGKINPNLPNKELKLLDIQRILPEELVLSLKRVYLCGNYGDPLLGSETLEIFAYLRKINPSLKLSMNTNGSYRSTEWWRSLATCINRNGDVKFGIDGLFDTHAVYRRGTDFDKIIQNAKTFIEYGGKAIWEFIVFKHNEHQVEEARSLSKELGFFDFRVKKTGRFFSNSKMKGKESQVIHNELGEVEGLLERPTLVKFQNSSLQKEKKIIDKFGSMESYLNKTSIDCKTASEKSLYISSEGLVFPCCWTANQLYLWYTPKNSSEVFKLLEKSGGKEKISALTNRIEDIIKGPFFSLLGESWNKDKISNGKLKVCSKTCGQIFDQFKDQYR